jgi:hypothetical protein
MGTGVGEAMLIGAAVGATAGGAGAAIQGGDPLKGALTGGALGAVGGGLGAGFGAAGGTAAGGTSGAAAGGTSGAAAGGGVGAGSSVLAGSANPALYSSLGTSTGAGTFGSLAAPTAGTTFGSLAAPTAGTTFGALAAPTTSGIAGLAVPTGSALAGTGAGAIGGGTGALGGSLGVAGYTPGMYATGAATMPGGAASLPGNFTGMAPALSNTNLGVIGGGSLLASLMQAERDQYGVPPAPEPYKSSFDIAKFKRSEPTYAPEGVYRPEYRDYTTAAEGGIMKLANGGPVERMSQMNTAMNPQGGSYPQGMIDKTQYATPTQRPVSAELMMDAPAYERSSPMLMAEGGIADIVEAAKAQGLTLDAYQNIYGRGNAIIEMEKALKEGKMVPSANMASGGISSLGGYSDGGRMLKGPGDGMSDSIPGVIAGKQPARLADGEFVVPADVVSHLGNGSTDAGAKQLYAMMDKVRKARTGKKKQAPAVKANRYIPV